MTPADGARLTVPEGEAVDQPYRYGDPFDPDAIRPATRTERAGLKSALDGLGTLEQARAILARLPRLPGEPDGSSQHPRPAEVLEYELRRDRLLMLQRVTVADPAELCGERDAVAATRPAGCWCLGAGGRELQAVVPLIDGVPLLPKLDDDEHPPMRFARYCCCPEAEAERRRAASARERLKARVLDQRVRRLVNAARIPPGYEHLSLGTFPDRAIADGLERWYRRNLQRLSDRADGRPWPPESYDELKPFVVLWGRNRTGKTGLALGCIMLALEHRQGAIFRTLPDLLDELRASYDPDNQWCHADLLAVLKNVPLLVIDDLGAQRMTAWVPDTMYVLINHRVNEKLMTIFTTNLDPDALLRHLGERIFWRCWEPAHEVEMNGPLLGEAGRILKASLDPFRTSESR